MTTANRATTQAQPAIKADQLSAEFVSEWDGGFQVTTAARVDLLTGALQIEVSDHESESLTVLDREFFQLACGAEFETQEQGGTYFVCDLAALRAAVGYTGPTVH